MTRTPVSDKEKSNPQRRLWCRWYDQCLDEAIERRWSGFSCGKCDGYEPGEWDQNLIVRDALACKALLITVFDPKATKFLHKHSIARWLEEDERRCQGYDFDF